MKNNLLRPLHECQCQAFLGTGLHTLGLLNWLVQQLGRCEVFVSTFSTSEEFLSGFLNIRKKGLISHAVLMADLKASRKTVKLQQLMARCFDSVYLAQNHSKVLLLKTESGRKVAVVTSQNQTYGGRAEATMVTTDDQVYDDLFNGFIQTIDNSILVNGIFPNSTEGDRTAGRTAHSCLGNFRPFGVEE